MNTTISKITVSNCHVAHDLPGVIANLQQTGSYVEGQDSEETLREFLRVIPTSILVAKSEGNDIILGSVYLPFSQIPILARLVVNPIITDLKEISEIKRALYNRSFAILRERHPHMPHIEELYDWGSARPASPEIETYKKFGFNYGWD